MTRRHEPDPRSEELLRQRLHRLADHAPTAVRSLDDAAVVSLPEVFAGPPPRRNGRRAAGIGATIAMVAAGLGLSTFAFQSGGEPGAASPEEAVRVFAVAVANEDVLGVLDILEPEEGAALRHNVERTASEASRIGLLDDTMDLGGLSGIDITMTDLQLEAQHLEPGLAAVIVTSGEIALAFDPATFGFGPIVDAAFGDDLRAGEVRGEFGESSVEVLVAVVERNGRWFVSPGFTAAEYARRAAKHDFPGPAAVVPSGAADPAAAATAMYERLFDFDLPGALSMLAPGEGAALVRYSPLWLDQVAQAAAEAKADGWAIQVSGLAFDEQGDGSRRLLVPTAFVVEGSIPPQPVYDDYPYDPSLPTLVHTQDGFAVIAAGEPIPATIEGLKLLEEFPDDLFEFNTTWTYPDGRIEPLNQPPRSDPDAPQTFRVELADGCTTVEAEFWHPYMGGPSELLGEGGDENIGDGVHRMCGPTAGTNALLSMPLLMVQGTGAISLPAVEVVEMDGRWYVSPWGTIGAVVPDALASIPSDANVLDTWMAPYFLNGMSRPGLENYLVGQPVDTVVPACAAVVVSEGGTVTSLIDNPSIADLRRCAENLWSDDAYWGAYGATEEYEIVPADTMAPLQD